MHRFTGLISSRGTRGSASTRSLNSLTESQDLRHAMAGAVLIMNDDVDAAEEELSKGTSSFHKLGRGVVTFIKATLGFEQDIMREASDRLGDAESSASGDLAQVQKLDPPSQSAIYNSGAEYALCAAEAQLMMAVVGVLNESLTESLRGFYRVRQAFKTLEGLAGSESKYAARVASQRQSIDSKASIGGTPSHSRPHSRQEPLSAKNSKSPSTIASEAESEEDDDDDDDFFDADESHEGFEMPKRYQGSLELDRAAEGLSKLEFDGEGSADESEKKTSSNPLLAVPPPSSSPSVSQLLNLDPEDPAFSNDIDGFIHSGVNLCFGVLLLLISTIPPAFSKILYIVGFRGDKEKGMLLLWQASKFHNIHGALAALVLLAWYNALIAFCDVVPDPPEDSTPETQIEGYPMLRLRALLSATSQRYPKSQLWVIERARMASSRRQLATALDILKQPCTSPLKQVTALYTFEKSLNAMFAHEHILCAQSFLACVDLNSWSIGLYFFNAGASHLALYRRYRTSDPDQASKHAKQAETYFREAPLHTGKRKIMARQLPFDQFVSRKIQKWEQRSKEWDVPFVDAIGVAPTEEMNYLWNGYKKMDKLNLEESLRALEWSEDPSNNPTWMNEGLDEKSIIAVLRAALFRNLRKHDEAMEILKTQVLNHPKQSFKGTLKDDWTAPVAHYEMGVNLWMLRTQYQNDHGSRLEDRPTAEDIATDPSGEILSENSTTAKTTASTSDKDIATSITQAHSKSNDNLVTVDIEHDRKLVAQSKSYMEKVKGWERYELDSRIGLKVTSAWDAIGKWEARYGDST